MANPHVAADRSRPHQPPDDVGSDREQFLARLRALSDLDGALAGDPRGEGHDRFFVRQALDRSSPRVAGKNKGSGYPLPSIQSDTPARLT